jgi:hypothetical protein
MFGYTFGGRRRLTGGGVRALGERFLGAKPGAARGLLPLLLFLLASCTREAPGTSTSPKPSSPAVSERSGAQPKGTTQPQMVRITIPEGTEVSLTLLDGVGSSSSQAGDTFTAKTTNPVVVGDRVGIPVGSKIRGQVTEVVPAKKGLKDKGGAITLSFDKVETPSGFSAPISATVTGVGKSGKKTAGIIGGSAAGGAILGKILGGSTKDAALGAVVGGAIGTGIAAGTRGKELDLPAGSHIVITLEHPLTIAIKP